MQSLKELINNPATKIIDVRSPMEFQIQHFPGAVNIPLDTIASRIAELKSLNTNIIVYCQSGGRSSMAKSILVQAGMDNVFNGGGLYDMQINLN